MKLNLDVIPGCYLKFVINLCSKTVYLVYIQVKDKQHEAQCNIMLQVEDQ